MPVLAGVLFAVPYDGDARSCWNVQPERSQLVVHVPPAGLFSPALHEHHFVPSEMGGRVCFDPQNLESLDLELTVAADSLEDRQPELSKEDLETVHQQVRGPDVLDASSYPTIRFVGTRMAVSSSAPGQLSGTLHGELTLRGQTRELQIPVSVRWAEGWLRAVGEVQVQQRAFGIKPYSRFLGSVRVADRVTVEFAIDAVPN